jgi:ATP phosphoribosyltransferase regulatory subunit HisZ
MSAAARSPKSPTAFLEQSTLKAARCRAMRSHHQALPRDRGRSRRARGATARARRRRQTQHHRCDRPVRKPRRLHGRARHRHGKTRFSTSFGRGLDYYTGFEFELHRKGNGIEPLVAGGRYDG